MDARGGEHEEAIYYIAGYVLCNVSKRAKDKRGERRELFALLEQNAAVGKEAAESDSLPIQRVVNAKVSNLYYASRKFYEFLLSFEAVFDNILTEENVYFFGTLMLDGVTHYLGKIDLGLSHFLPGADDADIEFVQCTIIDSYGNLRGKDFDYKVT